MSLSPSDIEYVRDLVRQKSAIVIDPEKAYLFESRLGPIVRKNGLGSLTDLVGRLRREPTSPLHELVVDAMTTNETSFFRDVHPWTALQREVIPKLMERRTGSRCLTFWSAACSSGQEPYALAMVLKDRFPQLLADWNVRIIATDLSSDMLGKAMRGRYTQMEVNRGLPATMLVRHFTRVGAEWEINEDIRQMVEFRLLNLCSAWHLPPAVDVIFMRNVLIYFGLETKREILGKVHDLLSPDGSLLLGTAETTLNIHDGFVRVPVGQATTYQRR